MADFVKHTACPECGSRDNLAMYDDQSGFCFGCGHYIRPDMRTRFEDRKETTHKAHVTLPGDFQSGYIPIDAKVWFDQYEITTENLKPLFVGWSESNERVIIPYIIEKNLCAWQGRLFQMTDPLVKDLKRPKWKSQGGIHEILYVLRGNPRSDVVYLVEDIISALKLKLAGFNAIPLFGSQLTNKQRLGLIYSPYNHIVFWLDRDKAREAMSASQSMKDYASFTSEVVITEKDPKEITFADINGMELKR